MWKQLGTLLLSVVAAMLMHQVHLKQVQALPRHQDQFEHLYLPSPAFLQLTALGHESMMADLLWLQTIQYYGDRVGKGKSSPYLLRYFDAITTLDPDFTSAYILGRYIMSEEKKMRPDVVRLLEKGIRYNPDVWVLPYQLAMFYYLYEKNYVKAADYFLQASRLPDAPLQTKRMAAQLYHKKTHSLQHCQTSLKLWSENLNEASDKYMRERSERHLIETRTLCDLLYLRQALESYQKRQQKQVQKLPAPGASASPLPNKPKLPTPVLKPFPASLQELVKVGLIPRVPLDFWGRPYLYQPKTGRVQVQPFSWEVYDRELTPYLATR